MQTLMHLIVVFSNYQSQQTYTKTASFFHGEGCSLMERVNLETLQCLLLLDFRP